MGDRAEQDARENHPDSTATFRVVTVAVSNSGERGVGCACGLNAGGFAKISAPVVTGALKRARLFRLLESLRASRAVWISASPGAGKTTLVSHYLEQKKIPSLWYQVDKGDNDPAAFFCYFTVAAKRATHGDGIEFPPFVPDPGSGVHIFSQRFFELVFASAARPLALVFDNVDEVEENSPLMDILAAGLASVPDGFKVFIISRGGPPARFMRLVANREMAVVGGPDFRLLPEEIEGIVRLRRGRAPAAEEVEDLARLTDGWAAGLALALEWDGAGRDSGESPARRSLEPIYGYFAAEIFGKLDEETRRFLIYSAAFPADAMEEGLAASGFPGAGRILASLAKKNCFVFRKVGDGKVYEFHPLFRKFLTESAAATLEPEAARRYRERAAEFLVSQGRWEEAAALCVKTRLWDQVASLLTLPGDLYIAQGRYGDLGNLTAPIPREELERLPWLMHWKGMSLTLADPEAGFAMLGAALNRFIEAGDANGRLYSVVGIIENIHHQGGGYHRFGPWLAELEKLTHSGRAIRENRFGARLRLAALRACVLARPVFPSSGDWIERAECLLDIGVDPKVRAEAIYCFSLLAGIRGDTSRLDYYAGLLDTLPHGGEGGAARKQCKALLDALCALFSKPSAAPEQRVEAADGDVNLPWSGMAWLVAANAALTGENLALAEEYLRLAQPRVNGRRDISSSFYHAIKAGVSLLKGDSAAAQAECGEALRGVDDLFSTYPAIQARLACACVATVRGERRRAVKLMSQAARLNRELNNPVCAWEFKLWSAWSLLEIGKSELAARKVRDAMAYGNKRGFAEQALFFFRDSWLSRLCAYALERGVEREFVARMIQSRKLSPPEKTAADAAWPMPVRVFTLGRFVIQKGDAPLRFAGKSPKRPLELLKAIIALGGANIPAHRLMDMLWPESDGDMAYKTLTVNLARLRKLLGTESALIFSGGAVGVNESVMWVDSLDFMRRVEAARKSGSADARDSLLNGVLAMYGGPFLPGDEDTLPWADTARGKLAKAYEWAAAEARKNGSTASPQVNRSRIA